MRGFMRAVAKRSESNTVEMSMRYAKRQKRYGSVASRGVRSERKPRKFLPNDWTRGGYNKRDAALKALGFKTYKEYLKSDLWQSIRTVYLGKFPLCFGCGKPANQIHHKYYNEENLSGRSLDGMFSICASCHEKIEFKPSGMKTYMKEANRWLFKIRKQHKKAAADDGA